MTLAPFARAEIIAVGSELLMLGRVDTNSSVITDRLDRRLLLAPAGVQRLQRRFDS